MRAVHTARILSKKIHKFFRIYYFTARYFSVIMTINDSEKEEADTMTDKTTLKFTVASDDKENMRRILRGVYEALTEKGYNPINQIVGYLLTEDPTYITNYNNARSMICKIDRDELMQALVRDYLFAKD